MTRRNVSLALMLGAAFNSFVFFVRLGAFRQDVAWIQAY